MWKPLKTIRLGLEVLSTRCHRRLQSLLPPPAERQRTRSSQTPWSSGRDRRDELCASRRCQLQGSLLHGLPWILPTSTEPLVTFAQTYTLLRLLAQILQAHQAHCKPGHHIDMGKKQSWNSVSRFRKAAPKASQPEPASKEHLVPNKYTHHFLVSMA